MTKKQIKQFNRMREVLFIISWTYASPKQLRKDFEDKSRDEYIKCLETAYEYIQTCAEIAINDVQEIKEIKKIKKEK